MAYDLSNILPTGPTEHERLVAVMIEMQKGIDMLTSIAAEHRARMEAFERDTRMLRARIEALENRIRARTDPAPKIRFPLVMTTGKMT